MVVLAAVGLLLLAALTLLLRGQPRGPIGGGELLDITRRVDGMQVHLASMPDPHRIGAIEQMLGGVQAQLATLSEGMRRQDRMLDLVMQTLLERDEPCRSGSD